MDLSNVVSRTPMKVRLSNLSHILREHDIARDVSQPRPIVDEFEVWSVPFKFKLATAAAPYIEVELSEQTRADLVDVLIKHFSDMAGARDAGVRVYDEASAPAIDEMLHKYEKEHDGKMPTTTSDVSALTPTQSATLALPSSGAAYAKMFSPSEAGGGWMADARASGIVKFGKTRGATTP